MCKLVKLTLKVNSKARRGQPSLNQLTKAGLLLRRRTMRKLLMAIMVLCAAGPALGLTPIGPPVATLDKGQFAAGFGYSQSTGDIKVSAFGLSAIVEDVEVDTYLVNLLYGFAEDIELQIDLGASSYNDNVLSSSGDFAGGFVLRSTFGKSEKVKWGVASSMHWYEASGSGVYLGIPWTEKDTWTEIQIAVGPSYTENRFCLYGGSFLHFIDGEAEGTIAGVPFSGDFEEDSNFGGFVGAQIEIAKNTYLGIEGQATGSAEAVGVSILWRF